MKAFTAGAGVKGHPGDHGSEALRPVVDIRRGGVEAVEELASEWRCLCEEGPYNQPFFRPEWVAAYLRNFHSKTEMLLITARSEGRLVAVLPLVPEKRKVKFGIKVSRLRGPSEMDGWPSDIVVASGPEGEAAVSAIWHVLEGVPGWDVLELPNVPLGGAAENLIRAASARGCPTYRLEYMNTPRLSLVGWGGGEPLSLARSKNLRHTLRRILHKVGDGNLVLNRFDLATDEVFEKFYALEKKSWKGKEGRTVADSKKIRGFYTEVAQAAAHFGYLSFYFLEFMGREIASRYTLTLCGRYHELECVYDEEFSEYAPGHLIVNEILSDCMRRGFYEIGFTGHSSEFKERWTSEAHPHSNLYIFRNSLYGRALYAAKYKVRPYINRVKEAMNRKAKGSN